ncbi:class F sortase [Dactylosporangium salmoneum]|uniref:Class F sortase n=1 Tax=Dactylosporangium salmoneum TaxID=53361 RepID=A0ABP5V828_9ACTN
MTPPHRHRRHSGASSALVRPDGRWRALPALFIIALVVAGVALIGTSLGTGPPVLPVVSGLSGLTGEVMRSASVPVRVAIAAIGVDAPVERVDVSGDGILQPPSLEEPKTVGWYRRGPTPGERGNAVLVGHVDTAATGPAVFYELGRLRPGDAITVTRQDGSAATFAVEAVRLFDKSAFPADLVYGPAPDARLELVTCGGSFDRRTANYLGNTVVTARFTG